MSADTMPCGCLGHVDYEDMCRYPALQKALEHEREAHRLARQDLIETIRQRDAARQETAEEAAKVLTYMGEVAALTVRAEQAERERDGIKAKFPWHRGDMGAPDVPVLQARYDALRAERDDANAARERAEADNAALSKHIDAACHLLSLGQVERAVSYLRKAASHEYPGAALLERVRALEAMFEVACEMDSGDSSTAAWTRIHEACAAADALKGKP